MDIEELRKIKGLLIGIFLLMLSASLYLAKDLILPIVFGVLMALTLSPVQRGASRWGIPAPITATVLVLLFTLALAAIFLVLGDSVRTLLNETPTLGQELRFKLSGLLQSVEDIKTASKEVEELANGGASPAVREVVLEGPGLLQQMASNAASFGTSFVVGLILALFLLASGDLFYVKLIESFRRTSDKKKALTVVYDVERRISHYLLTITVINALLGLTIMGAMYMLDVPYPRVWGLLGFLLNYLPFIGGISGTLAVAGFCIATFDSLAFALVPPAVYGILTSVEANFITPALIGKRLEMNAVSVLLTVIIWGWLWGITGALMAVPFLVMFKVICDNVPGWQTVGNFFGDRHDDEITPDALQPDG